MTPRAKNVPRLNEHWQRAAHVLVLTRSLYMRIDGTYAFEHAPLTIHSAPSISFLPSVLLDSGPI